MNHAMGGKSQLAGLVAAAVMAAVLLFLTGPLRYLPKAALGAILIVAAIGLFDVASLRRLWRVSRAEFGVAIATMLGVIALDVLEGILMAVALALLLLLKRSARPPDAVLGRVPGMKGFHDLAHHADASPTPGLLLYRFGAAIVFFNAAYFKRRVLELAAAQPGLKWVVIDGSTVNTIDSTGADTVETLAGDLGPAGHSAGTGGLPQRDAGDARACRCDGGDRDGFRLSDVEGGDERLPGGSAAPARRRSGGRGCSGRGLRRRGAE